MVCRSTAMRKPCELSRSALFNASATAFRVACRATFVYAFRPPNQGPQPRTTAHPFSQKQFPHFTRVFLPYSTSCSAVAYRSFLCSTG